MGKRSNRQIDLDKLTFKNECERMSGFKFSEFVSRIKVNAYDALTILSKAMESSGTTPGFLRTHFNEFNSSDFIRKVDDQTPKPNNKKGIGS